MFIQLNNHLTIADLDKVRVGMKTPEFKKVEDKLYSGNQIDFTRKYIKYYLLGYNPETISTLELLGFKIDHENNFIEWTDNVFSNKKLGDA